jgi:hypothetical protein
MPAGACAERSRSKRASPGSDVIPASVPESPYTVLFSFYETTPHSAELFFAEKAFFAR